jgi:hypothetical protein
VRRSVCSAVQPIPPIDFDAAALAADELALETLGRLQLAAKRHGTSIRLRNACPELVDLLTLVGLADVLGGACESGRDSGVEVNGQAEQCEQARVDEEVHLGDPIP